MITDWLMVIITGIYVIATIFICVSNYRSANASKEQLHEMKKQQEQNIGIQLYEKRKEVISNFNADNYNKYYWDIMILFPSEIFDDFVKLSSIREKINDLENRKDYFENHLKDYNIEVFKRYKDLEQYYKDGRDEYKSEIEEFLQLCDKYSFAQFYEPENQIVNFGMRIILKNIDDKTKELSIKEVKFSLKLKTFLKESISAK